VRSLSSWYIFSGGKDEAKQCHTAGIFGNIMRKTLALLKKKQKNKNINAIEEQTIHKFKIFNTRLIISGFIAVF